MPLSEIPREPRIGILVVAYNAASTLARRLDRIPTEFRGEIHEVLVGDDYSQDTTHLVALGYQQTATTCPSRWSATPRTWATAATRSGATGTPSTTAGTSSCCCTATGSTPPSCLVDIVEPIVRGEADAVFGSRIMTGAARRGGMPLYKYVGNRILTSFENALAGGAHRVALRLPGLLDAMPCPPPFDRNSDGFNFDTEIIIQLHEAG